MTKLILEVQVSLDGYMAGEDGSTNWMVWNWGPEWTWDKGLQQYHTDLTKSADRILLSSHMAQEGFIAHWKQVAAAGNDAQAAFASHIANTPKLVISSKLTKAIAIPGGWDQVEIASDPVDAVRRLKEEGCGSTLVYGGATLVSSLIEHQLIDEMHLLVNPILLGGGLNVFEKTNAPIKLSLIKSIGFPCGVVASHYRLAYE